MTQPIKYAGIGSRATPDMVLDYMSSVARRCRVLGWVLRSGGADGADTAFEKRAGKQKEIFLPWHKFNGNDSLLYTPSKNAVRLASVYHPAWDQLSRGAQLLHARNAHQILGQHLDDPVEFVVCWTPDGAETHEERSRVTGGTGMAISIASEHDIEVFNLANHGRVHELEYMMADMAQGDNVL